MPTSETGACQLSATLVGRRLLVIVPLFCLLPDSPCSNLSFGRGRTRWREVERVFVESKSSSRTCTRERQVFLFKKSEHKPSLEVLQGWLACFFVCPKKVGWPGSTYRTRRVCKSKASLLQRDVQFSVARSRDIFSFFCVSFVVAKAEGEREQETTIRRETGEGMWVSRYLSALLNSAPAGMSDELGWLVLRRPSSTPRPPPFRSRSNPSWIGLKRDLRPEAERHSLRPVEGDRAT